MSYAAAILAIFIIDIAIMAIILISTIGLKGKLTCGQN